MTTAAALLAAIRDAPDDPAPYLVYADWLTERGDPRGDFIVTQHALETATGRHAHQLRIRAGELLRAHGDAWIGITPAQRVHLVPHWRRGFIAGIRVVLTDRARTRDALDALAAIPDLDATLAELRIGPAIESQQSAVYDVALAWLAEHWPPALRRLAIGDAELRDVHRIAALSLRPHAAHAARLEELVLQARTVDAPPLPALRRLELRMIDPAAAHALEHSAPWPALETLCVWTTAAPVVLNAVLDPARFPRLRHLGLRGSAATDTLVGQLRRLPALLARLETLDLAGGTLRAHKPAAARELAAQVQLDLRGNCLAPRARSVLAAAGALVDGQRDSAAPILDLDATTAAFEADQRRYSDAHFDATRDPDPAAALAGLTALAAAIDHLPLPSRRNQAPSLYGHAGQRAEATGDLLAAEAWHWRAVEVTRWNGNADGEIYALGQVGGTRLQRSLTAEPIFVEIADYYRRVGRGVQEGWALRQQGRAAFVRGDHAAAEAYYQQALALAHADASAVALTQAELATVLWARHDYAGAESLLRASLAVPVADTHLKLATILNAQGRIADARAEATHAYAAFAGTNRLAGEAQSLALLGELAQRANDLDHAEDLLARAVAMLRALDLPHPLGIALGNLAKVAAARGDLPAARRHATEALEHARAIGNQYSEGSHLIVLMGVALAEGALAEAVALGHAAIVPLAAIGNRLAIAAAQLRLGIAAQLGGDAAEALRRYDVAELDARAGNFHELHVWINAWRATVAAQAGDRDAAARALATAAAALLPESIRARASLAMATAVVAHLLGDRSAALPAALDWDTRILAGLAQSSSAAASCAPV